MQQLHSILSTYFGCGIMFTDHILIKHKLIYRPKNTTVLKNTDILSGTYTG